MWQIRREPEHGSLEGADNDVVYRPEPGFSGSDSFRWTVSDGLRRSRDAVVTVRVSP